MTVHIQRSIGGDSMIIKLAGRIQAADVPELMTFFEPDSPLHGIVLDLEQVKLLDREAVLFLALSEMTGAKLRDCSAYIREWITQEKGAMSRHKSEAPSGFAG